MGIIVDEVTEGKCCGPNKMTMSNRYEENKKLNSVALVRKRTIPTERPPLVGEVSANFSG
jgi:hypothetical protein